MRQFEEMARKKGFSAVAANEDDPVTRLILQCARGLSSSPVKLDEGLVDEIKYVCVLACIPETK